MASREEVPGSPWSDDFDAPDIRNAPIVVYATDDDGFSYGLGLWSHRGDGSKPELVWADSLRPINDGIERALCWRHFGYPGVDRLSAIAQAIRSRP